MWKLSKMLSAFWGLLGLITIATLFVIYTNFPDYGTFPIPGYGISIELDRHTYFFSFCGLYFTINLILYIAARAANNLKKVFTSFDPIQHLRTMVSVKILACGANIFLMSLMIYSKSVINTQNPVSGHWLLIMVGPFIMVAGLIYLFYILVKPYRERDALH